MKYIVGENAAYVANGRTYKPGDEIDSSFFKREEVIKAAIAAGKLKPITASGDTGAGGTNTGDTASGKANAGDTGTASITPKKRKAMERAAVDNGLGNPEEIKSLSDNDLAELLTAAGVEV
jgi:hypothetical protein